MKAETAGAANWVESSTKDDFTGGTNMDTVKLCKSVAESTSPVAYSVNGTCT